MKDEIKLKDENAESYDKMQIALAIKNSTLGGELECSIINNGILKSCDICELKTICEYVDDAAEQYIKDTTIVIQEFTF